MVVVFVALLSQVTRTACLLASSRFVSARMRGLPFCAAVARGAINLRLIALLMKIPAALSACHLGCQLPPLSPRGHHRDADRPSCSPSLIVPFLVRAGIIPGFVARMIIIIALRAAYCARFLLLLLLLACA